MLQNGLTRQQHLQQNAVQTQAKPQQQMSCRICLEDMSLQQTFTVCLCKGANGYVHQKCLTEWAKKAQKYHESINDYFYNCQICTKKIYLKVDKQLKCLTLGQIRFMGDELCCTLSSTTILMLGLCMFSASLYLRLVSNDGSQQLLDIALGCACVIILLDVVISVFYFTVHTDITVIGIVIRRYGRRKQIIERVPSQKQISQNVSNFTNKLLETSVKISNCHQRDELNVTQLSLLPETTGNKIFSPQLQFFEEVRNNIVDEQIRETHQFRESQLRLNRKNVHINKNNVPRMQVFESKIVNQHDELGFNSHQNRNDNNQHVEQSFERQQPFSQSLFFQCPKLQNSSLTSAKEHTLDTVQVRSILCHTHQSYQTEPIETTSQSLYFREQNDLTTSQIQLENELNHNQIPSISKNISLMTNTSRFQKYRNTQPRPFLKIKKTESLQIGENHQQENQIDDVEIYYPKTQLKEQIKIVKKHFSLDQQQQMQINK